MMVMIMMRMIMICGDDYADGKYTVSVSEVEEFIKDTVRTIRSEM